LYSCYKPNKFLGNSSPQNRIVNSSTIVNNQIQPNENSNQSYVNIHSNLNLNTSQISSKHNNFQKNMKKENLLLSSGNGFCKCNHSETVTYFCRVCNKFICRFCRIDKIHKTHLNIHLDPDNLEESVKLYAITIQADLSQNLKISKKYNQNFKNEKLVDPSSRKEMIMRKLDEIERTQENILSSLPYSDEKNDINTIISQYEKQGLATHKEVDKVLDSIYYDYTKSKKRITFEDTQKYFNLINSKEKELEEINYNLMAYKYNFQVHKKIDDMYKIIERAIDAVLTTDYMSQGDDAITLDMLNAMKKNLKENRENKSQENNTSLIAESKLEIKKTESSARVNKSPIKRNISSNQRIQIEAKEKDEEDKLITINESLILDNTGQVKDNHLKDEEFKSSINEKQANHEPIGEIAQGSKNVKISPIDEKPKNSIQNKLEQKSLQDHH
jgi:hypothetical protein